MNRRHHQPTRNSSTQSLRGQRGGQFSTSSSRGNTYDLDNEYETSGQYQSENRANYSGASTSWGDDAYESGRAPTFRELTTIALKPMTAIELRRDSHR